MVGNNTVVRHRFTPAERKLLWRIGRWNRPDEWITQALPLLQGHDVHALARFASIGPDEVAEDPDPITLTQAD